MILYVIVVTATDCGNEPFGDADRLGPRHRASDEPGAGHVWSSGHIQPFIRLQPVQAQQERPWWGSAESGELAFCKQSPVVKGDDEL